MRILITVSNIPIQYNAFTIPGGAEKVAWDLAKSLSKKNEVFILTFGEKDSFKMIENIGVYFIKNVNHGLWYYMTLGRIDILRIYNKIKPDVIHSHMHSIITFTLRFKRANKILTLHNSKYEHYHKTKIQKLKHNLITKKSLNKYKITTVSKHMQKYLANYLKKEVTHIPNGINNKEFYFKKDITTDKKIILYVGRLEEFKGVRQILEASRILKEYKFQFIGLGTYFNFYQTENVHFLGRKKPNEIIDFYNKSFISVFPSKYENYPLVGLEAMACGSLVLANNIDGFREYIIDEENGFLADLNSPKNIINKIKEISKINNFQKIRQNAFNKVNELNIDSITEKYMCLYNQKIISK